MIWRPTVKTGFKLVMGSWKIIGVEYYQAVIRDGVRDYSGFKEWRKQHPVTGVVEWMP